MTGFIGTALILLGYLWMALRKDPAWVFAAGSAVWMAHGIIHEDWWLMACNAATTALGIIAIIRGRK